jgi:SET family sugar efflux transporter-like MFS transporter
MRGNRVEDQGRHIGRLIAALESPTVLRCCIGMLLLGVASAIVLPYASLFALNEVRMTPGQFGVFSGAASLSGVVCSLMIGHWTDSHGRREPWLVISLLAGMAGYAIYATTSVYSIILCAAVSLVAVFNSATAQFLALARARLDSVYEHDVNLPMGIIRAAFSLAWTVGPPIGAVILAAQGFSGIFVCAIALLAGVVTVVLLQPRQGGSHVVLRDRSGGSVLPLLASHRVLSACIALCAFSLCSGLALVGFPVHLAQTLHEPGSTVGYLFGLAAALEVLLMLIVSFRTGRVQRAPLLAVASVCYAIYAFAVFATTSVDILFPLQFLNALATSIFMTTGMVYLQDLVPGRPGIATALFGGALNMGTMLSGPVFAILYGQYGTRAVFLAATVLSLLTSLPNVFVHRRSQTIL